MLGFSGQDSLQQSRTRVSQQPDRAAGGQSATGSEPAGGLSLFTAEHVPWTDQTAATGVATGAVVDAGMDRNVAGSEPGNGPQASGPPHQLDTSDTGTNPGHVMRTAAAGAGGGYHSPRAWPGRPPPHHPYRGTPTRHPYYPQYRHHPGLSPYSAPMHPYPGGPAPPLMARRPHPGFQGHMPYGMPPPMAHAMPPPGYGMSGDEDMPPRGFQSPFLHADAQEAALGPGIPGGGPDDDLPPEPLRQLKSEGGAIGGGGPGGGGGPPKSDGGATSTISAGGPSAGGGGAGLRGPQYSGPPPQAAAAAAGMYNMPYGAPYRSRQMMYGYPPSSHYYQPEDMAGSQYARRLPGTHSLPLPQSYGRGHQGFPPPSSAAMEGSVSGGGGVMPGTPYGDPRTDPRAMLSHGGGEPPGGGGAGEGSVPPPALTSPGGHLYGGAVGGDPYIRNPGKEYGRAQSSQQYGAGGQQSHQQQQQQQQLQHQFQSQQHQFGGPPPPQAMMGPPRGGGGGGEGGPPDGLSGAPYHSHQGHPTPPPALHPPSGPMLLSSHCYTTGAQGHPHAQHTQQGYPGHPQPHAYMPRLHGYPLQAGGGTEGEQGGTDNGLRRAFSADPQQLRLLASSGHESDLVLAGLGGGGGNMGMIGDPAGGPSLAHYGGQTAAQAAAAVAAAMPAMDPDLPLPLPDLLTQLGSPTVADDEEEQLHAELDGLIGDLAGEPYMHPPPLLHPQHPTTQPQGHHAQPGHPGPYMSHPMMENPAQHSHGHPHPHSHAHPEVQGHPHLGLSPAGARIGYGPGRQGMEQGLGSALAEGPGGMAVAMLGELPQQGMEQGRPVSTGSRGGRRGQAGRGAAARENDPQGHRKSYGAADPATHRTSPMVASGGGPDEDGNAGALEKPGAGKGRDDGTQIRQQPSWRPAVMSLRQLPSHPPPPAAAQTPSPSQQQQNPPPQQQQQHPPSSRPGGPAVSGRGRAGGRGGGRRSVSGNGSGALGSSRAGTTDAGGVDESAVVAAGGNGTLGEGGGAELIAKVKKEPQPPPADAGGGAGDDEDDAEATVATDDEDADDPDDDGAGGEDSWVPGGSARGAAGRRRGGGSVNGSDGEAVAAPRRGRRRVAARRVKPSKAATGRRESGGSGGAAGGSVGGGAGTASAASGDELQIGARPTVEQLLSQSVDGVADLEVLGDLEPQTVTALLEKVQRKGKGGRAPAEDPRLDPSIDPRKARRILANRISAARSKLKQKLILEGLKARYQQLLTSKNQFTRELADLRRACKELESRNRGLAVKLKDISKEPPKLLSG